MMNDFDGGEEESGGRNVGMEYGTKSQQKEGK
jgi:hypothetical protein